MFSLSSTNSGQVIWNTLYMMFVCFPSVSGWAGWYYNYTLCKAHLQTKAKAYYVYTTLGAILLQTKREYLKRPNVYSQSSLFFIAQVSHLTAVTIQLLLHLGSFLKLTALYSWSHPWLHWTWYPHLTRKT